jgi:hypothetical protein
MAVSALVAVASAAGWATLRWRHRDVRSAVTASETRMTVGDVIFVIPPDASSVTVIRSGHPLAAATLDLLVRGSPVPSHALGIRKGKNGSIEVELDLSVGGETVKGVLRARPRKSPASLELSWSGPRPPGGAVEISLTFNALSTPPILPATLADLPAARVPYALAFPEGGAIATGASTATVAGGPPWSLHVTSEASLTVWAGSDAEVNEAALRRAAIPFVHRRVKLLSTPHPSAAVVVALDENGRAVSGARPAIGSDEVDVVAPTNAVRLGAMAGGLPLGAPGDGPTLEIAALGRLSVSVRDFDRDVALPVRIIVHGIDGAREPNFGAPHRGSGAGPLVDADDGTFTSLLPSGRYRVIATRGLEYTVDQRDVEVPAGGAVGVSLALRHVLDTPGWAACDLHVHSRGSFDSTVSVEDRVRSLIGAGIDFAAASEHNRTGTYASPRFAAASQWMTWAPAVEVTTTAPLRGHFNVIPWESPTAPKHQRTTLDELLRLVRRDAPDSLVQVNHPRLGQGMGHFDTIELDAQTSRGLSRLARGFDTIEVYNGFDLTRRARVEAVVREWLQLVESGRDHWATGSSDSHAIQYETAGWPRTYVAVESDHEDGLGPPVDVAAIVGALKRGHAVVTSGPLIEITQGTRGPGDSLVVEEGRATVHVRVRTAPWVEASTLSIMVAGKEAAAFRLPSRPLEVGLPTGSLADARARAVVFEADVTVDVPSDARALVAMVRGERTIGAVLPFMEFSPLALSNPLIVRALPGRAGGAK